MGNLHGQANFLGCQHKLEYIPTVTLSWPFKGGFRLPKIRVKKRHKLQVRQV